MSEYSLGDAMKQYLNASRLKNGLRAVQIEEIWEKIMGKTIAKYTDKLEIIQKTLFITTAVGPLKQELSYQKKQIIQFVNEEMGEEMIDNVVVR